jgi:hypothetical protein
MTRKTPSDFSSHDDWLSYVRSEIPGPEQPYALAFGRAELFRSVYQIQRLPFPIQFAEEMERIETLHGPARAVALESLNDVMFRNLTECLLDRALLRISENDTQRPASPREEIEDLFNHLARKNPYFALWTFYKRGVSDHSVVEEWDEYLIQELGTQSAEEIAFTRAMVVLDKLLVFFHDESLALPSVAFERIWFLHSLPGPERMLRTRAVLGMLTAELAACTSA